MTTAALAQVGGGYWGRNLARNFHAQGALAAICDASPEALAGFAAAYPGVRLERDWRAIVADPAIRMLSVATPPHTHFEIAAAALAAGKDVFVEKPICHSLDEIRQLNHLAAQHRRVLMVGHLLEYHPVVERLRNMIVGGELGEIYYVYSQRLNLGTIREDENALWNFAPHDISSILYMLGREPTDVSARGQCYLQKDIEDVVFLSLNFGGRAMAHIQVSWLDPHKTRKLTVVGSRKMAVFDDLDPNEKLRIYDKGARINTDYDTFAEYMGLRFGDITVPYIKVGEPLRLECLHFLDCVMTRKQPLSDGRDGLRVVRVLDAAQRSLKSNGVPVRLDPQG